jgi:wobble nucleotide-excising tRNase
VIKGIAKIKGLGVYENYTKPAGTQEFGVKNLIYGWNYSGKTTLSRLFAQLENKTPNPDLSACSFTIETDSDPITEANFTLSNLTVRVFNSDFVRDNLNFTGQSFKPILLLGKESEEAQVKLNHCEDLSTRTQDRVRTFAKEADELESAFSSAKTAAAAKIKKTLGLVEAYTATHLGSDITTILHLKDSQLLAEDKYRDDLKLALTPDSERPDTVERLTASPSVDSLYKEAVEVLAATPSLTSTIKHLEENPLIEKWVETGLVLHSEKDKCEFCGGDLSKHRLAELQAHFSKDLADNKSKVEQLLNRVKAAKVSVQLPKEAEFNPQFRDKFCKAAAPIPKAIETFNNAVDTLAEDVQQKINAPFKAQAPTALPKGLAPAITDAVKTINQVIDDNNQVASNFTNAKRGAIKRVKLHCVQEFIDEQAKVGRVAKVGRLKAKQKRLNRFAAVVQMEADKLRAIISQAQLGREEINKRLSFMLGSEAVQIKVVPDSGQERFQLVRTNGKPAKNLSDGEKTAIAFSYFLTKLKELKPEQFKATIVYIDDPISSLDANHIFQVTAAIRELFFHQVQRNGNLEWTTTCKQIFISTHNFEFFHLLREVKPDGKNQAPLYLMPSQEVDSCVTS